MIWVGHTFYRTSPFSGCFGNVKDFEFLSHTDLPSPDNASK